MGQGIRTGLGHGGITCVLQTQFSSFLLPFHFSFLSLGDGSIYTKILSQRAFTPNTTILQHILLPHQAVQYKQISKAEQ